MKIDKILCFVVLIACVGCATPFGKYMKDRGNDFADCFKADVGYGYGLDVTVKATDFVATGVGASSTKKVGFKGRYTGKWEDRHWGFLLIDAGFFGDEGLNCPWSEEIDPPATRNLSILGINLLAFKSNPKKPLIDKFDLECGVTVGVIGTRVGFSPGQTLDFILGWFGIDIGKDE